MQAVAIGAKKPNRERSQKCATITREGQAIAKADGRNEQTKIMLYEDTSRHARVSIKMGHGGREMCVVPVDPFWSIRIAR